MATIKSLIGSTQGVTDALSAHLPAVRAAEEALRSIRSITENSAVRNLIESMERDQAAMRAALGPFEDFRCAGLFAADSPWLREAERMQKMMAEFESRFRLPEMPEVSRLMAAFQTSHASAALVKYDEQMSAVQKAMVSMIRPWLDVQKQMRSLTTFAELQGIGHALQNMPAFGENLSAALRLDLGDWRDPITWRPEVLADLSARSHFYAGLGFNPALTDFPAPAFQESLDIAGLRQEPPSLVDLYGDPLPRADDEREECGLARTNMAHDWLLRLETQLRAFIDERMTLAFGADWPKRRLPNGLHDQWQEKKRKAEQAGVPVRALIAYADFTDYELVICKRDNWRELFGGFFGRPESVRESFQRLHPIRLDTMHARPITQDDELFLYVETRRLIRVIVRNG
jgi:hypothetical protein